MPISSSSFPSMGNTLLKRKPLLLLLLSLLLTLHTSYGAPPLALPVTFYLPDDQDQMILSLRPYDIDTPSYKLITSIVSLPNSNSFGGLYKPNSNYIKHGDIFPVQVKGDQPLNSNDLPFVLDSSSSNTKIVYARRKGERRDTTKVLDTFMYTVSDGVSVSLPGIITIVSPTSKLLMSSSFDSNSEGWTIQGNLRKNTPTYEASSRGKELNHYIFGTDDSITSSNSMNTHDSSNSKPDTSLWRFVSPSKFHGNFAAAYLGSLKLTVSSFSGDFNPMNLNYDSSNNVNSLTVTDKPNTSNHFIKIHCKTCKVNTGLTIAYPFPQNYNGKTTKFNIPINENDWLLDPETSLQSWAKPSKCEFLEVLSSISEVTILGDFTKWYESVAIDDIQIVVAGGGKGGPPICMFTEPAGWVGGMKCSC